MGTVENRAIKENRREQTFRYYHLRMLPVDTAGPWEIPVIQPCDVTPDDLMGENYMYRDDREPHDFGIHFFLDDYQFERWWKDPLFRIDDMRSYQCMLTPDFSLYTDMTLAMQMWNVYRSRFVGAIWQRAGLNVIPTLQWSTPESYHFVFDGLPTESIVATSTIGVNRNSECRRLWCSGMTEALNRLHPSRVLCYGFRINDFDWAGTDVRFYEPGGILALRRRAASRARIVPSDEK